MRETEDQRAYLRRRGRGPGPSTVDTTGSMPNEVWTVRAGSAAIIVVRGELDVTSADETLGAVIKAINETSYDRILIDLADVTFMDAAGLGAVISARRLANGVGTSLDLVTSSKTVSRLLRLAQRQIRISERMTR
jgi:anti-anti-sigma factor